MAENMRLYLELMGRSGNLRSTLNSSRSAVTRFTGGVKRELSSLRSMATSVQGQLATLGLGFSAVRIVTDSARLDKNLTRTRQTLGATVSEMAVIRRDLFTMARQTGQPLEDLQAGLDTLAAAGLNAKESMAALKAINIGSAVTGAQSPVLGSALTTGASIYKFDLSKPGVALEMLDQMRVASIKARAELNDLADIFSRIGVNASSAGMGFTETLAFVEGLSLIEKQPERLGTLADSTLRLFTNAKYMKTVQKSTGVRFFDQNGGRRNALEILGDLKGKHDTLQTAKARAAFYNKVVGGADLDTQKGFKALMDSDYLSKMKEFNKDIAAGAGTLVKELSEATSNMVDQVNMLKNDLREAADGFVQPMNKTLADWTKWARDSKENGGLGLDGKDMIGYGIGGAVGALALSRYGGKFLSYGARRLLGKGGAGVANVATGKALEHLAGITPVFVVNMPGSGLASMDGPNIPSDASRIGRDGAGKIKGLATKAAAMFSPMIPALAGAVIAETSRAIGEGLTDSQVQSSTREWLRQKRAEHLVMGGGSGSYQVQEITRVLGDGLDGKNPIKNEINMNITIDQNGRATSSSNDPNTSTTIKTMKRGSFAITPMASH